MIVPEFFYFLSKNILPYFFRRFVYGSPNAYMTLSRGVIGPIFPNDQPVGLESIFPNGNGRFGKGSGIREFLKMSRQKKIVKKFFFPLIFTYFRISSF